jgi:N6-adenosine-specific RNA methylase IME4
VKKPQVLAPGRKTRREWVKTITASWNDVRKGTFVGFMRVGNELIEAKAQLDEHGEWLKMIGSKHQVGQLPFQAKIAQKLMAIAKCVAFKKALIERLLPPDYNTLYKLQTLHRCFPDTFTRLIEDGTITPSLQRNEISKILRMERVEADEQRVLDLVPVRGTFRTIVLDPAWEYSWLSLAGRAKPGYAMQTIEQLMALDVMAWADKEIGTQLYLWTTNNFMAEACKLVAHWGFQHRTVITWIKPPPFGLGSYFRNSTEHCLFATFGNTTTRPAAASLPTHFEAPRGEHSQKPERFYEFVRAASYPPYGEGNQRAPRPDFTNLYCPVTEGEEPKVAAE